MTEVNPFLLVSVVFVSVIIILLIIVLMCKVFIKDFEEDLAYYNHQKNNGRKENNN